MKEIKVFRFQDKILKNYLQYECVNFHDIFTIDGLVKKSRYFKTLKGDGSQQSPTALKSTRHIKRNCNE